MIVSNVTHQIEVWGDFACFSRPELSVERVSYPLPTPGAARGIFEAIYFKPAFRWQIEQIELLNPPAYIGLRRNEVKDKIPEAAVKKWMAGKEDPEPLFADADKSLLGTDQRGRTQRQTMALREPRFRLTARIIPRPGYEAQLKAYDEQFRRRASQGKCFTQPCLGAKEFVAFFEYVSAGEPLKSPCNHTQDLGYMVYDVFDLATDNYQLYQTDWRSVSPSIAVFAARIERGVMTVPPYDSPAVLKPARSSQGAL